MAVMYKRGRGSKNKRGDTASSSLVPFMSSFLITAGWHPEALWVNGYKQRYRGVCINSMTIIVQRPDEMQAGMTETSDLVIKATAQTFILKVKSLNKHTNAKFWCVMCLLCVA